MKHILFVDDEPQLLDGLRDLLRKQRACWDMVFVGSGQAALDELARRRFDVVVSDMRMPGMDGATLLAQVKALDPSAVRIILSGHAERESIVKALPVAHQFLSKPCDANTVRAVIERACSLRAMMDNDAIRRVVGRTECLPSVPRTYLALCEASSRPDASLDELAGIVEQDPAMTVKILQIVNSSYFGLAQRHSSLRRAVAYLGTDLLKGLALTANVFASTSAPAIEGFSLEALREHSVRVARLAESYFDDRQPSAEAFTAGMVHDIGKVVLATGVPEQFADILAEHRATGRPAHQLERAALGVSHGEVGAYLLGLWGLPLEIVEAVAFHHEPEARRSTEPGGALVALHVADALIEPHPVMDDATAGGRLDAGFVAGTQWGARLPHWRELAWRAQEAVA